MSVDTINERAAEEYFSRGKKAEDNGETERAVEHYDHALNENPDHDEACFRLARLYDQHGLDSQAIDLYERVCGGSPVPVNALLNLAVLYEDNLMYDDARRCLRAVLATAPDHPRARLFLRDVDAAHDVGAVEAERMAQQRDAILDQPVSDFDLSVRARNALVKANIESLGDLLRVREADLMGFKNFGETSLAEIKSLLATRGLRLGQFVDGEGGNAGVVSAMTHHPHIDEAALGVGGAQAAAPQAAAESAVPAGDGLDADLPGELMDRPIADLELSVRSRKALQRLDIKSIGELCSRSDEELLGCKNFGQTSLNEIKQILASFGLQLRRD